MLDRLHAPYPWLVIDGTEDFVYEDPQRGEVLFYSEGSKWILRENQERLLLEGRLPLILIISMHRSLPLRVHLLFVIVAFERVVDGTLHSLLQLNARLASKQDLTHSCDIMLQQIFVQGVRNLQPADERECRYIFTAVGNFGEPVLKIADVRLEAINLPHFDREEVVVILLGLPAGGILREKRLSYLLKIVE